MIEIDARGLSCPIPVVKTRKAIEVKPHEKVTIMVDTAVAKENISRLAASKNYAMAVQINEEGGYCIYLTPPDN